jgi:hypothetical protein
MRSTLPYGTMDTESTSSLQHPEDPAACLRNPSAPLAAAQGQASVHSPSVLCPAAQVSDQLSHNAFHLREREVRLSRPLGGSVGALPTLDGMACLRPAHCGSGSQGLEARADRHGRDGSGAGASRQSESQSHGRDGCD